MHANQPSLGLRERHAIVNTTIGQIRQGDILLIPVDERPPAGLKPQQEVILAYGEVTGHAHRLSGAVLEWEEAGRRLVRAVGGAGTLRHEDHDPEPASVVVAEQTYCVVPQREWDLSGQWRQVVD